jgi:hypothetical protein
MQTQIASSSVIPHNPTWLLAKTSDLPKAKRAKKRKCKIEIRLRI